MKPYYEADGVTIYHGDCRDVLPSLSGVDVVVTDPPYGIGKAAWDCSLPLEWFGPAMAAIGRGGAAYVFGDAVTLSRFQVYWEERGVRWGGRICWTYEDGPRNAKAWTGKHEDCLFWAAPDHELSVPREPSIWADKRWGDDRLMGDVWRFARVLGTYGEREDHPTQKPLKLLHVPISSSSRSGGLVLDPFVGSGSTLRAALDLGRRAIGIEIEERYCEIAAKRLSQTVLDFGGPA